MQHDPLNDVPTGIEYLNQIATPPPRPGFDKKSKLIIAVMAIVGLLSLLFIFVASQNARSAPTIKTLAGRLHKLQTITDTYNGKLRATAIQDTSSSLKAVLKTANTAVNEPLSRSGVDPKKQAKEIAALDPADELDRKLSDAFLNTQLDLTYAHEMNIQLTDTLDMIAQIQKATSDDVTQKFLTKTHADLQNIKKQLVAFMGS